MNRTLLTALLLLFAVSTADAANLVKTYSYFSIGGRSLEQIQSELSKRGPSVKSTGMRHPGATRMAFTSRIGYADEANSCPSDGASNLFCRFTGYGKLEQSCRIVSAVVTVKTGVVLPRWKPRGKVGPDVRLFWNTLAADIKRHEDRHVEIAKDYGHRLESALMGIGQADDCKVAAAKAKEVTAKILTQHDQAQVEFDRVEMVNFESRIIRLMRYRIQQIEAGRLPG
ncbi:DUF922 domain-containing Zn-dependent protease [Mesorhizobium sp. NPDC059054]|uniref:DUF922 domain-containing Zn-dependent protease n=1 Tax=Mesorhizobium sp. NPDC059054 TaxID=3346711 RepID=UPI00368912F6